MKSEHTIQLLLSGMLTWIGSKFQTFGMLILSLLFLMIIDYITGMLASRKEGIEHRIISLMAGIPVKDFWES